MFLRVQMQTILDAIISFSSQYFLKFEKVVHRLK